MVLRLLLWLLLRLVLVLLVLLRVLLALKFLLVLLLVLLMKCTLLADLLCAVVAIVAEKKREGIHLITATFSAAAASAGLDLKKSKRCPPLCMTVVFTVLPIGTVLVLFFLLAAARRW